MKRGVLVLILFFAGIATCLTPTIAAAYNFGDYRSSTLVTKGWEALAANDIEAVLAYTNKCIELYAGQAKKMQESLNEYPAGDDQKIFGFWALNDVATAYYIQGETYRKAGMNEEAKEAYQKVINEYKFGQCWDTQGWFWKPAEAAAEKLDAIDAVVKK